VSYTCLSAFQKNITMELMTRRDVLRFGALALTARAGQGAETDIGVNDVHSKLNSTQVARVIRPETVEQVRNAILAARAEGLAVSVSGSRHSMGGQQFASGAVLLDMRVLALSIGPLERLKSRRAWNGRSFSLRFRAAISAYSRNRPAQIASHWVVLSLLMSTEEVWI
jgi:hypothetical protein